ncbi:MAG: diaminopimelate epimerase [Planctomycetes bacterium]|nr:diaminopimelate epimerase [Planctomycetota bacterium]
MNFTKMHGLGNDYVYVDCFHSLVVDPAALARRISARHTGVGSDGLILITPSQCADVRMVMFNADGSRAQMCGNGIRCVAKYAVENGLAPGPRLTIETDAGVKAAECVLHAGLVRAVRVDMGRPSLDPMALPAAVGAEPMVEYPLSVDGRTLAVTCVSVGNPHAVVFVENVETVALSRVGPLIETAPQFPQRINAHFAVVESCSRVRIRTWERGAGATQACGTGACAVCVAGAVTGRTDRTIEAVLPGGSLTIEWAADEHVYMTGPAVEVFRGTWPDEPADS